MPWSAAGSAEQDALDAALEQLMDPRNTGGAVWIRDYARRFAGLRMNLRELLERHPDKFTVHYDGHTKFHVSLVNGGYADDRHRHYDGGYADGRHRHYDGGYLDAGAEKEAVAEALEQLRDPRNSKGEVWIRDFKTRYAGLRVSLRELLERHPDMFTVHYDGHTKFHVSLVNMEKQKFTTVRIHGRPQRSPERSLLERHPDEVHGYENSSTEKEAVAEALEQLRDPRNSKGEVWIRDYKQRYAGLRMSLRELLERHPDKFTVHPDGHTKFHVSMATDDYGRKRTAAFLTPGASISSAKKPRSEKARAMVVLKPAQKTMVEVKEEVALYDDDVRIPNPDNVTFNAGDSLQVVATFTTNGVSKFVATVGLEGIVRRVDPSDGWAMIDFKVVDGGKWVSPDKFHNLAQAIAT